VMSILGHLAYIHSSNAYWPFNNGGWFTSGAALVSCAAELKILALILEKKNFEIIVRQSKGRFIQLGLVAIGNILFLIGTLIIWKVSASYIIGPIFNAVGGCFLSLSISSFFIS
jgi:hypothetical protein